MSKKTKVVVKKVRTAVKTVKSKPAVTKKTKKSKVSTANYKLSEFKQPKGWSRWFETSKGQHALIDLRTLPPEVGADILYNEEQSK
jgi:hypothetical protein